MPQFKSSTRSRSAQTQRPAHDRAILALYRALVAANATRDAFDHLHAIRLEVAPYLDYKDVI